jgi:hypothetical protein
MQKVQLSSGGGWLLVGMVRLLVLMSMVSPVVVLVVAQHLELSVRIKLALQQLVLGIGVAILSRRLIWRVYATEEGIVLGLSKTVVPWADVEELRDLGWVTGFWSHLHWLRFKGKRKSQVFYAHCCAVDDYNRMRARYHKE